MPGEKYVLSAWVKDETSPQPITYTGKILFSDISASGTTVYEFLPTGPIIDGWQRIVGEFKLQQLPESIQIQLISANGGNGISYFDDFRIFPYNGNLKSFVYDPVTQRLMAELDENNYATLYEYDKEGGLIRVKKETERGIYTIQETRSGNSKLYAPQ
ncbi:MULTISPECIES: hypothetical protein [Aequorivita]|uniref:Uncharacterized protein n=1 Tax=Aequorivita iocasae TaxID=2803865 RepID=A0ABX7DSB9_9FLAO|nr:MULTISPECIES: hypothetical protein [Aequorivita]QQX76516.1 hypothetical protein JK629_14505 [Aequorivita iocasae]UCA55988.1 hypothetical protein LDL78_14575 [Aequorivita sp. F7]